MFTPFHIIKAGIGRLRRPAFDARAAVELARFGLPFFPATRYALAPSALLTVVNDVMINGRRTIVELGSGYSSVYLARALDLIGAADGRIFTVDADPDWLNLVIDRAAAAGVGDRITPVLATIRRQEGLGDWYDREAIMEALGARSIDLLLVDGPVASGPQRQEARAPAAQALKNALGARCAIYLDDVHRPSHARIAARWGELLGLHFTEHHARGGFAYAARGDAFDPII